MLAQSGNRLQEEAFLNHKLRAREERAKTMLDQFSFSLVKKMSGNIEHSQFGGL